MIDCTRVDANERCFFLGVRASEKLVSKRKKKKKNRKNRKKEENSTKKRKRKEKRNKVEKGETCGKKNEERVKNDIARRLEICPRIFSLTLGVAFMLRRGAWLVS